MPLSPAISSLQRFRRVAITKPPQDWFYKIPARQFEIYRRAFIELGLSVFEVDVDAFLPPDAGRIASLLADLCAFKPDLAVGLPYGTYALICRMPPQRGGSRPNLFSDVLEIPTICIWDHAPVQEADQLMTPLPQHPSKSTSGALDILRHALSHPLLVHWSRDSGQTRIMQDLGFVRAGQVVQTGSPALPGFSPMPVDADEGRVAFIGNLYQDPISFDEPDLEELKETAIRRTLEKSTALWDEIAAGIATMPAATRKTLALEHDQTFFWRFAYQLIEYAGQTKKRLHFLEAAGTPVDVFGNFRPDAPDAPKNLRATSKRFAFGPELAAAFARYAVVVDVVSSGFVDGYSFKSIIGFASGGFVLVDRKRDFIDAFGELGAAVSYANREELAAKVDRFLTNPRERQELGDAMRAEIEAKQTFARVFGRVLQAAAEIVPAGRRDLAGAAPAVKEQRSTAVRDLLPDLRNHPHWLGARLERRGGVVVIVTSPEAWAYSAEIPLGRLPPRLREPHAQFELVVDEGRIGLCAIDAQTGELISEQVVSAAAQTVSLSIELPRDTIAAIIIRNARSGPSRARLLRAALCERN